MSAMSKERRKWYNTPFTCKPPECRSLLPSEARQCSHCGSVVVIGGDRLRLSSKRRFFCDLQCTGEYKKWHNKSTEYREKTGIAANELERNQQMLNEQKRRICCCSSCGCAFVKASGQSKFCDECRPSMERLRAAQLFRNRFIPKLPQYCITCERCGVERMSHRNTARFCSERCRHKASKQNREHVKRSKSFGSVVSLHVVVKKHKSKCALCGVVCKKPSGDNNPYEATIDHVLPLSKGGLHIMSNVQLLCRQCNTIKNDTVNAGVQLMLKLE